MGNMLLGGYFQRDDRIEELPFVRGASPHSPQSIDPATTTNRDFQELDRIDFRTSLKLPSELSVRQLRTQSDREAKSWCTVLACTPALRFRRNMGLHRSRHFCHGINSECQDW